MKIGMIGLGKMGGNMTTRLLRAGHDLVVYDRNDGNMQRAIDDGAIQADNLEDVVRKLEQPRSIWIMVPAGDATESVISQAEELLEKAM